MGNLPTASLTPCLLSPGSAHWLDQTPPTPCAPFLYPSHMNGATDKNLPLDTLERRSSSPTAAYPGLTPLRSGPRSRQTISMNTQLEHTHAHTHTHQYHRGQVRPKAPDAISTTPALVETFDSSLPSWRPRHCQLLEGGNDMSTLTTVVKIVCHFCCLWFAVSRVLVLQRRKEAQQCRALQAPLDRKNFGHFWRAVISRRILRVKKSFCIVIFYFGSCINMWGCSCIGRYLFLDLSSCEGGKFWTKSTGSLP